MPENKLENVSSIDLLEELRTRTTKSNNAVARKLIFLGAPGSGKGTQADALKAQYNVYHISTGDILRDMAKTESDLGKKVKETMERGELVGDELMCDVVTTKISSAECAAGFILDGFPRSTKQAETLERHLTARGEAISGVYFFDVPHSELLRRITGRRVHPGSGRSYHVEFNPPKVPDVDDITGEPLIHRKDDTEETLVSRLKAFDEYTSPLVTFYEERGLLRKVDASKDPKEVSKTFLASFKSDEERAFERAVGGA